MTTSQDGSERGPFWPLFEQSHIPMALVDRNRRYVAVNDAALELFQYPRDVVIGELAGRTSVDVDPATSAAEWAQLLRAGEFYGERVVEHAAGNLIHVSYAAHATMVGGEWMALLVTLSAHLEPDGAELIGTIEPRAAAAKADAKTKRSVLTPREREVVRRVALGASTRQIAADMFLSPATVRSHVRNAMVKTGAHTRAQLVAIVLGEGLVDG
jgi:PAS domain S-box-containing protein